MDGAPEDRFEAPALFPVAPIAAAETERRQRCS